VATALRPPCDETLDVAPAGPCIDETGTLAATILGSSLAFVVGSIINVALPSIQSSFEATAAGAQWIVNAYLLPVGALVLTGGALGDRYGRKRVFLSGIAVFSLGSLLCALAPTLAILLAGRVVQGIGAALMAPNSLAILASSFSGEARGRAVGTWASASAVAGAAAPLLGGLLVDTASWRWAFLVVVPPAILAAWIGHQSIRESRQVEDGSPLDWLGAGLGTAALAVSVWALITLPQRGLGDPSVVIGLTVGFLLFVAFAGAQARKGARAMMPLSLFSNVSFAGISMLTFFLYAVLGGLFVLLPYVLIEGFGFSATAAGAGTLPFPIAMGLLSRRAGVLAGRLGVRWMLVAGPALVAIGFGVLSRVPGEGFSYAAHVFPALLVVAVGMAGSVAPLTTAVMDSVPPGAVGIASGVNNAIARSAGLIATALLGLVLPRGVATASALIDGFSAAAAVGAILAALSSMAAFLLVRGGDTHEPTQRRTSTR